MIHILQIVKDCDVLKSKEILKEIIELLPSDIQIEDITGGIESSKIYIKFNSKLLGEHSKRFAILISKKYELVETETS